MSILIAGILTGLAIIFLLIKLNPKKIAYFNFSIDALTTWALITLLGGTFSGVAAGAVAGCMVSAFLLLVRRFKGAQKPEITRHGVRWRDTW